MAGQTIVEGLAVASDGRERRLDDSTTDCQPPPRPRCIFLLSVKSSGSSMLQRHLTRLCHARVATATAHYENETLFWTKAASVLGLPQVPMENSEVPIPRKRALRMLRQMVRDNAPGHAGDLGEEAGILAAWTAIVAARPGTFIEKSPHHLYQPSVVALMERYADQAQTIDVQFVGLVRNPVDTLYSSWRRFGVLPRREERHWIRAYELLRDFQARRPDLVSIVRYEDLVAGKVDLGRLVNMDGGTAAAQDAEPFHASSIHKWRRDRHFGYEPSAAVRVLAASYGYAEEDVRNPHSGAWWLYRVPRAALWATLVPFRRGIRRVSQSWFAPLPHRSTASFAARSNPFGAAKPAPRRAAFSAQAE